MPFFSVIIPARDEEKNLPICLASLKESFSRCGVAYEIIVVLNRCTDRTEEIARGAGCLIARNDSKNLSKIRNAGARLASGEIFITIDADSRVSPNLAGEIQKVMQAGRFAGGGVLILPERWSLGIIVTGLFIGVLAAWYRIAAGLFFCSREAYYGIGGFNEELSSVEDIDFARRLKAYGKKKGQGFKILLSAHIVTSCRKFDHFGDWFFLRRPLDAIRLLGGKDQKLAEKYWYDFPR